MDDSYQSKGLGLILCGTVLKGDIQIGQTLMFGPDKQGNFKTIKVKDIHQNRVPVSAAHQGMSVTLKVKQTGKNDLMINETSIRKGSFLINALAPQKGRNVYHDICSRYFKASIKLHVNHHTTISTNYQAVMHIGGVR